MVYIGGIVYRRRQLIETHNKFGKRFFFNCNSGNLFLFTLQIFPIRQLYYFIYQLKNTELSQFTLI